MIIFARHYMIDISLARGVGGGDQGSTEPQRTGSDDDIGSKQTEKNRQTSTTTANATATASETQQR